MPPADLTSLGYPAGGAIGLASGVVQLRDHRRLETFIRSHGRTSRPSRGRCASRARRPATPNLRKPRRPDVVICGDTRRVHASDEDRVTTEVINARSDGVRPTISLMLPLTVTCWPISLPVKPSTPVRSFRRVCDENSLLPDGGNSDRWADARGIVVTNVRTSVRLHARMRVGTGGAIRCLCCCRSE